MLRLPSESLGFEMTSPRKPQTKDIARIRHVVIVLCAEFQLGTSRKNASRIFRADWSWLLARKTKSLRSHLVERKTGDRVRWQRDFEGLESIQIEIRLRRCQCKNVNNVLKVLKYGEMTLSSKRLDVTVEFLAGGSNSRWGCDCCAKVGDIVRGYLEK